MSGAPRTSYAFRAQKSMGVVLAAPTYSPLETFDKPQEHVRTYQYSPDGRYLAHAMAGSVRITQADSGELVQDLPVPNVYEVGFSPKGTYISTWERPSKSEDGSQVKNLRVWKVETGEDLAAFTQKSQEGWNLQFTSNEALCTRFVSGEVQVFDPSAFSKGVVQKLRVEGMTSFSLSPGQNPSIAAFIAEKKGAPASLRLFSLFSLGPNSTPTAQKTFFKADKIQIKWNPLGTAVLFLTQTDVDKTNKSYYGETNLYLMSTVGGFDARVTLDRDGPIHDFAWSPNSKEFGVVYGYMPAKTVLFDQRGNPVHDFGTLPRNFIHFNPQGRLICVAGFGNLAGTIDVWDRRTLKKVATIEASNSSHCEFSPDGRFLLTATLSPRLRVDNGVKIWHLTGKLIHVDLVEELYQVSWRPGNPDAFPAFRQELEPAPAPAPSVALAEAAAKPASAKPAGAYRPPHARGSATPNIYKREDEGGIARLPSNGVSTPPNGQSNGVYQARGQRRQVPGAPPPSSPGPDQERKGRKKGGKKGGDESSGAPTPVPTPPPVQAPVPQSPGGDAIALDKKIRNLTKKLKAIEELKDKRKRGEKLEKTQLTKLDSEAEIRRELEALKL